MAIKANLCILPRSPQWRELRRIAGLDTDTALGLAMGMPSKTVGQVLNGHHAPSAKFIAHALGAFPFAGFRELFTVAPLTTPAGPEAARQ